MAILVVTLIAGCAPRYTVEKEGDAPVYLNTGYRWQSDTQIKHGPWAQAHVVMITPECCFPHYDTCTTISIRQSDNHYVLTDRDGIVGDYPSHFGIKVIGPAQ
jgi:hypothetical protein